MLRLNKSVKQISGKSSVILTRRQREQMGGALSPNLSHQGAPTVVAAAASATVQQQQQRSHNQEFMDLCAAYEEEEQGNNWVLQSWMVDYDEEPLFFEKRRTTTNTGAMGASMVSREDKGIGEEIKQAAKPAQSSETHSQASCSSSSSGNNNNSSASYKSARNLSLVD